MSQPAPYDPSREPKYQTEIRDSQRKEGESGNVRRELEQIARQLKGLSDRVKRLKEAA